ENARALLYSSFNTALTPEFCVKLSSSAKMSLFIAEAMIQASIAHFHTYADSSDPLVHAKFCAWRSGS
ncbi:MAG TPA: hypothetical protein VHY56_05345, partial [Candidatus Binataceae bacterium]|nr:hypothetical protein [Candidatus Binataceae bacterium]